MSDTRFHEDIQRVIEDSGLSKLEIASLYIVTVQTVYNWIGGGRPTQAFMIEHSKSMNALLHKMIDRGLLPFPHTYSRERRRRHLATVLRQVIRSADVTTI